MYATTLPEAYEREREKENSKGLGKDTSRTIPHSFIKLIKRKSLYELGEKEQSFMHAAFNKLKKNGIK